RVGVVAERHDDKVGLDGLGLAGADRLATPRRVRLAQPHQLDDRRLDEAILATQEITRGTETPEANAHPQRLVKLLHTARHLVAGTPVDDGDIATETTRRARRVHRGVTSTDDEDTFALDLGKRCLKLLTQALHEVDAREELIR